MFLLAESFCSPLYQFVLVFHPQKKIQTSLSLNPSLSCGLRGEKKHLKTVHTLQNCLQDTLFVSRAQRTHAIRGCW